MYHSQLLLAYIGPETVLPATSALVAMAGLILTFWRFIVARCRRMVVFLTPRRWRSPAEPSVVATSPDAITDGE